MLCNAHLEPLHAPAIRSALLNAADGIGGEGLQPGVRVLSTAIDLSENPRLGDAGVRGIFGVSPEASDPATPQKLQSEGSRKKLLSAPEGGGESLPPTRRPLF
jgi:hypothetical protein